MEKSYKKPLRFPLWSRIRGCSEQPGRYRLCADGIRAQFHERSRLPYANHIEMSGFQVSAILSYKIDRALRPDFYRLCVFPSLRVNPDDTRGSLTYAFEGVSLQSSGKKERVDSVFFNGILQFHSTLNGMEITRSFLPCREKGALIEELVIRSDRETALTLVCKKPHVTIDGKYTPAGEAYRLDTMVFDGNSVFYPQKNKLCVNGEKRLVITYGKDCMTLQEAQAEIAGRRQFLEDSKKRLAIQTPDATLNRMLEFTKIRASESIFQTKNGLMHSPGGGGYYAALWTNDQCEYANPFFAYLGYDRAREQSINCYRMYAALAKPDEAIYTSIVAQGDDYWHGAGDRGDSSMFVYGFTRYLLTTGDMETARTHLSSLETACTYVQSKMNSYGVVESDSDELENRFESGKANLSTAVITYDAFLSMAILEKELGYPEKSAEYQAFAEKVEEGIHTYFEADVESYPTYRYCAEEMKLRSWICLPLTVGIFNRLDGTAAALQSGRLKKPCGLLTRSGERTFWDRSLLYALRGLFYAGKADEALQMLTEYTDSRLYGEHVPYPVEAFPEGNAAHLSAESALYVRIFIEGILGFRPLGFHSFSLKPNLPSVWPRLRVANFYYAGRMLTIKIEKQGTKVRVDIPEINFWQETENHSMTTVSLPPN